MDNEYKTHPQYNKLRFFIGDVRDAERLKLAMQNVVSDKLFCAANAYSGADGTRFAVVRCSNVAGSRGSVIPFFKNIISNGGEELPITDYWMTRFWISLEDGVKLVIHALENVRGGKTFIAKIPSIKITDLVEAILPGCRKPEVGICEGEMRMPFTLMSMTDILLFILIIIGGKKN